MDSSKSICMIFPLPKCLPYCQSFLSSYCMKIIFAKKTVLNNNHLSCYHKYYSPISTYLHHQNNSKAPNMHSRSSFRTTSSMPMHHSPPPDNLRYYQARKSPNSINFPTSPDQPTLGEEGILHFTHSHPLSQLIEPSPFTCSGCKEYGAGKKFACQECDFQLHDFCALSPPVLNNHPLHPRHQLVFHVKPKTGGIYWPKCNICSKSTKGFTFRCNACNFQIHPCCAMLSNMMSFPVHTHVLKLLAPAFTTSSSSSEDYFNCSECRGKRAGRVYSCTVCDYHLHAVCAKNFVNGLQANGIKNSGNYKPQGMVGPAVRLASQAVLEFIGGLIEGIGDGVGQALIENLTKGKKGVTVDTNTNTNTDTGRKMRQ